MDGQFQKAGFDPALVHEVHGSIHHLQCTAPCSEEIWECREEVPVDRATMRAERLPGLPELPAGGPSQHPHVRRRGLAARPVERSRGGGSRPSSRSTGRRGSRSWSWAPGTAVATIRSITERLGRTPGSTVIRVNPREADIRAPHLGIAAGALEAIRGIDRALRAG